MMRAARENSSKSYGRPGTVRAELPERVLADQCEFEGDRLVVFRSVVLEGQVLGWVYLASDLEELHTRTARSLEIMALVIIVSWCVLKDALFSRVQVPSG